MRFCPVAISSVPRPPIAPMASHDSQTALVKQYCVTCHNERLKTGGLTLEQFFRLLRIEIETVAANKLQRVPLPGIVTGGDRNATICLEPLNRQLHARRRTNTEVDNFTTRGE